METKYKQSDEIRLKDIQVFVELVKSKSVRDLSRQLGCSPGQISKQIKSLELRLGLKLIERSATGIEATPEASQVLPVLTEIYNLHQKLNREVKDKGKEQLLTLGATSFVSAHLLPPMLARLSKENTLLKRFRVLDLPPTQFISVALRGGFQCCVHIGDLDWPKTWDTTMVGNETWGLYAAKNHPVPLSATMKQIKEHPFIYPVYWGQEGLRFGDDSCPLPIEKRLIGHETATATTAAELVALTEQLAFLPDHVAKPKVKRGVLKKIKVKGWAQVKRSVYLSVKSDYILQSDYNILKELLTEQLS